MKNIACITGATSGIGRATAYKLAEKSFNLILTGRREERLDQLVIDLKNKFGTENIGVSFDVRDENQVNEAFEGLPEGWKNISVLINNAGLASGLDDFDEGLLSDWNKMIDTNVKGLLYVSRAVSPGMVKRKTGQIINIGSLAGREVYPKGAVYTASKHAVAALTEGMRMDLFKKGIKVSAVCPGLVETEFSEVRFHGDKNKAKKVYEGYKPLNSQDVAECIDFVLSVPEHVNIADMLVLPTDQASSTLVNR